MIDDNQIKHTDMDTSFVADIQITLGGGKGAIVTAWVMPNPNTDHPNKYVATPNDGGQFPDGSTYMNNGRWKFVK